MSSDWPNHSRCWSAINHSCDGEVASRYARILFLWAGLKQRPMDSSVSQIRRWKRSRSRATSSQCPLRDACRANGHVRMTCTWTSGEKLTWKHRRKETLRHDPENSDRLRPPIRPSTTTTPARSQEQLLDSDCPQGPFPGKQTEEEVSPELARS